MIQRLATTKVAALLDLENMLCKKSFESHIAVDKHALKGKTTED